MAQTALYRHYDAGGHLLYVGISLSAVYRLSQHMEASSWADQIETMKIQRFPTREEAHEAERQAIRDENPAHNLVRYALKLEISDAGDDDVDAVVDEDAAQAERDAERARYELLRGAVSYRPVYSLEEASKALGISGATLTHWMANGECGHIVLRKFIRNYPTEDGTPHVYRQLGMTGWQVVDLIEVLQRQALTGEALLSERTGNEGKPRLLREPIPTPSASREVTA